MIRNSELWWTVALEATLFFSVPSWALTDRGWPGNSPGQFALAVLIGASTALLLFHIVPATCASTVSRPLQSRAGRSVRLAVGAWFCVGAAVSLGQMAHLSGSMYVLYRDASWLNQPAWRVIAIVLSLLCVLVPAVLAWRSAWQRPLIALCLFLGVFLATVAFWAQVPGLRTRNPQLISEVGLDEPFRVIQGMLMAAAPASILALRIGKMGLSSRRIWWTGIGGMWLPLSVSVPLL